MQIHDLNTKALTDPAYVAFDDGTDTYKTEFNDVVADAAADAVASADLTDNTVAFTSGDAASPTEWSAVSVITSGSTLATLFNRISTMVKNVRYLWALIGSSSFQNVASTLSGAIGNTALPTTATTLSGAIAEHETDISTLNNRTTYTSTANEFVIDLSGATSSGCLLMKYGNVRILRLIMGSVSLAQNGGEQLGHLTSGILGTNEIYGIGFAGTGASHGTSVRLSISASGVVKAYAAAAVSATLRATLVFMQD